MGRGGYRQGAGRKAGWRQGPTQTIRVPRALKEQLLKISRQLDRGHWSQVKLESKVSRVI